MIDKDVDGNEEVDDVHEDDGDDGEKHMVHCLVTVRLTGTC